MQIICMQELAKVLIALVALEHIYILWIEMFAWTTKGRKVFRTVPPDMFEKTKTMMANQGLYNGFLSAGLTWSLVIQDPLWWPRVAYFFLGCVIIAGVYGGVSVHRSVFIKQGLPALLAGIVLYLSHVI